ncbi:hypothetical protein VTI28DRAFT_9126 [Corynascus sepedonium]
MDSVPITDVVVKSVWYIRKRQRIHMHTGKRKKTRYLAKYTLAALTLKTKVGTSPLLGFVLLEIVELFLMTSRKVCSLVVCCSERRA